MKRIVYLLCLLLAFSINAQIGSEPSEFSNGLKISGGISEGIKSDSVLSINSNGVVNYILRSEINSSVNTSTSEQDGSLTNFVAKLSEKHDISYKYILRENSGEFKVVYVYGDKAITYLLTKDSNSVYSWIESIYVSDLKTTGLADDNTDEELAHNVQEFAWKYKISGQAADSELWFPYHGSGNSTTTLLLDVELIVDGINYDSFTNLPLDKPMLFDKIVFSQDIASRWNPSATTNDIEASIIMTFNNSQLHFNNYFNVLKDIASIRTYASRISLTNSDGLTLNTGQFLPSLSDSSSIFYDYRTTSVIVESSFVTAANYVNGFNENTGKDKSFYESDNVVAIFNRSTGEQTLYWSLAPFRFTGETLVEIPSGEIFESSNNLIYIPKGYVANDIPIDFGLSDGLKRKSKKSDDGWATYTDNATLTLVADVEQQLDIDSDTVIEDYLPADISKYWNSVNNKITGKEGDIVKVILTATVTPTTASTTKVSVVPDTNNGSNRLTRYTMSNTFSEGQDIAQTFTSEFTAYQTAQWQTNNARLYIEADANCTVDDIEITMIRIFRGN